MCTSLYGPNKFTSYDLLRIDGSIKNHMIFKVTDETCNILKNFGYVFEQRGLVAVKGKGQLMTYYLIGKGDASTLTGNPTMEPLKEEDENAVTPVNGNTFPTPQPPTVDSATRLLDDVDHG